MDTLKVSSKSNPNSVAGALTNVFRDKGRASVFLFDVPCYLCLQMRCVEAAAPAGYERGF